MTSGGHEVDVGGEGPTAKAMHWIIHSSALPQFWTPDLSINETTCLEQQETGFQFSSYTFEHRFLPPTSNLHPLT